jgi:hypothetical protein
MIVTWTVPERPGSTVPRLQVTVPDAWLPLGDDTKVEPAGRVSDSTVPTAGAVPVF